MSWNELFRKAVQGDGHLSKGHLAYLHETTDMGSGVLHFAVCGGNLKLVELLILHGLQPNHRNLYGESPLHWACKTADVAFVQLLLDYGADPNLADGEGNTPLHWAAEYDRLEVAEALLLRGASRSVRNDQLRTPSGVARYEGSSPAITLLLQQ